MTTREFAWDDLDELYREVILDHYRSPRNRRAVPEPHVAAEGINPFCGDEVTVHLRLDGNDTITEVGFQGQGCSISQASTSMMTEVLQGKSLQQSRALIAAFKELMHGKELSDEELERLGNLEALQGVRKFPIRIKCALLGWATLEDGLDQYEARAEKG
ncbi:MAG: Fe-S cluster assembly sulfur transfer protein SufU [Dehalococcoidia bacterium]